MNIVFFGSGAFGVPTIQALAERHTLKHIVTQPDRKAGRGRKLTPTPIAQWAEAQEHHLPVLMAEHVNDHEVIERIRAVDADAWVVIAFGQKLGSALLSGRFAINLHASLLPRWRGAAPINHAILAGDTETGNTVITLADRMDAGEILGQSRRAIDPAVTAGELHDLLSADGPALVLDVLERHESGSLDPHRQEETAVTLAPKLSKDEGWLNFALPADFLKRVIHGLTPWPGAATALRERRLAIRKAEHSDEQTQQEPGTIVDPERGLVACGRGTVLRLLEVQPSGKKTMPWADYARGAGVKTGDRFDDDEPIGR
ncbi:MAG: methionyl-tRNA formyltransferase [Phycisphaeraceae bacterium]|nr:methionyl-tRNA formyltransferase [Phycisphaeraceae bacterium]